MKINVCLVRTEYSANIGSVARAMANMGADRLILIDPKCKLTVKSRQMAAGAQAQLKKCTRYKSWEDFYKHEGSGVRIALTRRGGKRRKVLELRSALKSIKSTPQVKKGLPIYLIFGPEADGLDVGDLGFVNHCCVLPTYGDFGSMNISHAVLLALFIFRDIYPPDHLPKQLKGGENEAPMVPFYFPDKSIREWLTAMGFDINARKSSAYLTLKKLFLQNSPSAHELHVLESILQQNIRKLKKSALFSTKDLAHDVGDVIVE